MGAHHRGVGHGLHDGGPSSPSHKQRQELLSCTDSPVLWLRLGVVGSRERSRSRVLVAASQNRTVNTTDVGTFLFEVPLHRYQMTLCFRLPSPLPSLPSLLTVISALLFYP